MLNEDQFRIAELVVWLIRERCEAFRRIHKGSPDELVRVIQMPGNSAGECRGLPRMHLAS